MSSEYDDDMQQARAWLAMDPKEAANRTAELSKRQRQAAKAYGDAAAGALEPVAFVACHCIGCELVLTTQTHAGNLICHRCKAESDALIADAKAARDRHQSKLAKGVAGMWIVFAWIVVALCAAAVAGWAAGALAWQIGYRL